VGAVIFRRVVLLVFALWCLFPIYWILSTSLKTTVDALAIPPRWLFTPIFDNYAEVFSGSDVGKYFTNSVIVGLGSTFIGLLVGVPASYVLARYNFRRRADFDFWILSTRMTPPVAMLIPFFVMYRTVGLQDTHLGLMLAHVGQNLAIIIWVLKGFFNDLPKEIEEAALVDGCDYWTAFRRVVLPLALPGIGATGILAFLFSWNEFLFALVLTDTQVRTVPVGLYSFVGYQQIEWGQLSASAMLMLLPVLAFVLLFQRQLIRGLTLGAVRG
jgi:multiple sugar transport system permease protein